MNKTMLWCALSTLICTQVYAVVNQQPTTTQPTPTTSNMPQTPPNTQPSQGQPNQNVQQGQPAINTTQPTQAQPTQPIDCNYKIPATTKTIDQALVLNWSEKATTQAFSFDPTTVDEQIKQLKNCFTDQGWTGFNSALEKSGNLEAIKAQKLNVSSQIDGQTQFSEVKDNQWKLTLPLHVVYQNEKEKVTQLLIVNLTVGRKITGDLGILQMIATPRPAEATPSSTTNTNSSSAPSTTSPTTSVNTGPVPSTTGSSEQQKSIMDGASKNPTETPKN